MAARQVDMKLAKGAGVTVNFYVYGPNNFRRLVPFNKSGDADLPLERGVPYKLYWMVRGPVGGTLKVDRQIKDVDPAFVALLPEWKIPEDDRFPPGWPVAWSDLIDFTL